MNKLIGMEGGQPLYLDDLLYLQQSATETIKGLVSALGLSHKSVILSGCYITVSEMEGRREVSWKQGYIAIDEEVYPVKGGNITVPQGNTDLYWVVKTTLHEKREFENGAQYEVYEKNEVVISNSYKEGEKRANVEDVPNFQKTLDGYATQYVPRDILESVNTPDKVQVSCLMYENNSGFNVCRISVTVREHVEFTSNILFSYVNAPSFSACTLVVAWPKMYMLKMQSGAAYLCDDKGETMWTLEPCSFSVDLLIRR